MAEHQALIALGANLGDAPATLRLALNQLDNVVPQTKLLKSSSFFSSIPVGGPSGQPLFCNAVAEIKTSLTPLDLLIQLQKMEKNLGRHRGETWAARTIDLDILSYDQQIFYHPDLVLPHPRMTVRQFIIDPLCEISPDWVHPCLNWSVSRIKSHLLTSDHVVHFSQNTIRLIEQNPLARKLFRQFEHETQGWSIKDFTDSRAAMFEVHTDLTKPDNKPWPLPRFYPTDPTPETLITQTIATCRGLNDSLFRLE